MVCTRWRTVELLSSDAGGPDDRVGAPRSDFSGARQLGVDST